MIFGLIRRFVISSIISLLILVYLASYGVVRVSGKMVHYPPVPVLEPRHRVRPRRPAERPQWGGQSTTASAISARSGRSWWKPIDPGTREFWLDTLTTLFASSKGHSERRD